MATEQRNFRFLQVRFIFGIVYLVGCVLLASCGNRPPGQDYTVVNTYPHDRGAFTEGLLFANGYLYESTGLYGRSSLRRVDLQTGGVMREVELPNQLFGEGLALFDGKLYQLTWKNHIGFIYDLKTFQVQRQFAYPFEGWGLTTDGSSLIASDGSDQIRFIDPATLTVQRSIAVRENGNAVTNVNELEYVKGQIYANVWQTDRVLRIDPATGQVLHDYNLSGLLTAEDRTMPTDVLNGIAYDPDGDHLYVTGKLWPKLFEIKLYP
jgi:glutaminyl-peptide cyclotransferase